MRPRRSSNLTLASTDRLLLADQPGSVANIGYSRDHQDDGTSKELIYRSDLFYWVEYGTYQTQLDYEVLTVTTNIDGGVPPADSPVKTVTVTQGT